jgi:hypothetical protein
MADLRADLWLFYMPITNEKNMHRRGAVQSEKFYQTVGDSE